MKKQKLFVQLAALICATTTWATDYNVATDSELRAAIANDGANITVTADINLSNSTLSIATGTTVTIDLAGHTLDRKLTQRGEGGGQVITVRKGATLNLTGGTLKGGWGRDGGGLVNEEGTVTLTNVNITGNTADDRGGGISNHGTLTMTGGSITGNTTNDQTDPKGGGGIMNTEAATATLTGVSITGNEAKVTGGGGICNYGTLTLDGCTITGNSCKMNGGGIWTAANATLNMQGAITVTGNTTDGEVANNLFLKTNAVVTITGSLEGSTMGVNMESNTGTFTSGYNTHNSGADPATLFKADIEGVMDVSLNDAGNEAQLVNAIPEGSVYYVERSWDEDGKCVKYENKILQSGEYASLPGLDGDDNISINPGYYVVKGSVECHWLICKGGGKHHLILSDGAKLKAVFVQVNSKTNDELYIYGQSRETGQLVVTGDEITANNAGIGGYTSDTGNIVIHGGDLNVYGGYEGGAGIGGSGAHGISTITIYGGTIKSQGFLYGAGIGNGDDVAYGEYNNGTVIIYGGYIEARGGNMGAGIGGAKKSPGCDITIHGGIVKAWGGVGGAGIGNGDNRNEAFNVNQGTVTINGGEVYAYGGDDGAGIGGGWEGNGSEITINGGIVKAWGGGNGAGIGSGSEMSVSESDVHAGKITINDGEVYAYGDVDAAGIGGGEDADGGTVVINGGYVYAQGQDYGPGIGGGQGGKGGNITINGGIVIAKKGENATGAIGSGDSDNNGSLTLGDDRCVYITSGLWRCKKENRVSDCWGAAYLQISECLHGDATVSIVSGDKHSMSNCKWCYITGEEAHTFGEDSQCSACGLIRLADEGDNSALFTKWADGETHDFLLSGRKLTPNLPSPTGEGVGERQSRAYTVCLPFDMDLTGRDDLMLYTLSYIKEGKEMVFTQTAKKIEAGKPYLIVIHQGELELLGNGKLAVTADEGVRVYDWENREQPVGWCRGTLTKIESADAAEMMAYALQSVGDFRRIRPDTPQAWWGAFRSMYCPDELPATNRLTINKGTFGGFGGQTVTVTFEGDADIDDATSIDHSTLTIDHYEEDTWYDLSGRKMVNGKWSMVNGKLPKGVYIVSGKKVLVK